MAIKAYMIAPLTWIIRQRRLIDSSVCVLDRVYRLDFHKLLMQFRLVECGGTQGEKENDKKACHGEDNQEFGYEKGIVAYFGHKQPPLFRLKMQNHSHGKQKIRILQNQS